MSGSIGKTFFAALAGAALTLGAGSASADYILTYENGAIFGSGPFGTVQVVLIDGTDATITFTADSGYEFMDGSAAAVNVNATSFDIVNGTAGISTSSGTVAGISTTGSVDGFGSLNLQINLSGGSADGSTSISFTIHNDSGTWSSASQVLTPVSSGGATVAAHMYNFATPLVGSCTGFAGNAGGAGYTSGQDLSSTGGTNCSGTLSEQVPIPAAAWMFISGLLGLIPIARRRIAGKLPGGNLSPVAA